MTEISWQQFEKVDLHVGTIMSAEAFPEAIKPAYQLTIDFGGEIGVRKLSAQITDLYGLEDLVRKQTTEVVNFPAKRMGRFKSECLVIGFVQDDAGVVLAVPDKPANNGSKLA